MRELPERIQDFSCIRMNDYHNVDKTRYIYSLINDDTRCNSFFFQRKNSVRTFYVFTTSMNDRILMGENSEGGYSDVAIFSD